MKIVVLKILTLLSVLAYYQTIAQKAYQSSLAAQKDFPLYTTYAADMERSNFILDEGYHFQYYVDSLGADFTTDTGGDLALGFLMDKKWVYKTADMYQPVIIKTSYPDLVQYEYQPFKNIKVNVSFLVYSSTNALMNIEITNHNETPSKIEVVPFIRKTQSPLRNITFRNNGFTFDHEEHPDGWTISHNLPYVDSIKNFFSTSLKADDHFAFNSEGGESFIHPFSGFRNQNSVLLFHGRAYLPGKERLPAAHQTLKVQIFASDNDSRMITENVPVPGSTKPAMTNDGYYNLETGLLSDNQSYQVLFFDKDSKHGYAGTIKKEMMTKGRYDIDLNRINLPETPQNVTAEKRKNHTLLNWERNSNPVVYDIYKRTRPDLFFEKIASDIKSHSWKDKTTRGNEIASYVVIAKDNDGNRSIHSDEVFNITATVFKNYIENSTRVAKTESAPFSKIIGFKKKLSLSPGQTFEFSVQRSVAPLWSNTDSLILSCQKLYRLDHQAFVSANEKLFSKTPDIHWNDKEKEALYWSANNMMRQVFYPPEGKSSFNYYVFSREPTWGWGHGGQVFHESIAMLAYAFIDPESAMNSQRVYKERQYPNGYINYRTGSYLDEIIEHNGQLTSSAPWYSWLNWEVYLITKDKSFLQEMYKSSKKFYRFIADNRDSDHDGLCEWGGEAILESVRDALVAVWDQVGYPTNFESLDLNCMLVNEAKSLEKMALELGLNNEASEWNQDHMKRAALINNTFWDEKNKFYYNVNKVDHSFTFKSKDDLKRDEIIGFLPLWAGIATPEQARELVAKLTDTSQFWRKFGIPSLSASDPYYNPKGYWNGPVWVEWNYLIMRGLLNYGYKHEARELVDRIAKGMIEVLKQNHNLWEFYSPDEAWGGYHKTYIWAGIINRMMMDVY